MTLIPEIESRRSYRALSPELIPEESIERILTAAHLAPSCQNKQGWRFVAITGEALAGFRELLPGGNKWATSAPLIVAGATKPSLDCRLEEGRDYANFDLGMAVMNLMLQATREGLVAHPIAGYPPVKVRETLGIPEDYVVMVLVVIGKRGTDELLSDNQKKGEQAPRERRPLAEVAFRNQWPNP
jgi:glutaredoxin-dependent peroxiredoxin